MTRIFVVSVKLDVPGGNKKQASINALRLKLLSIVIKLFWVINLLLDSLTANSLK